MSTRFWFFDLDGTLADTDGDIRLAWKATLADLGLDASHFDERFVTGPSIDEVTRMLYPEAYSDELAAAIRRRFGEHYDADGFPTTREYPGVLDVVRTLKRRGDAVAIVTNKRHVGAVAMASKFGWMQVFDALYAGDMHKDDAIGKLPKAELLALAMRECGATPERSAMVGDTVGDFSAARANGVLAVAVDWGYGRPEELAGADIVVRDAEALLGL